MPSMRALRFEAYGPPSALSLQDIPVPSLNPGEVLVKVHASAVNPSDVKIVSGLFSAALPSTPGRDFAGTVVAGDTWIGKEVWGSGAGFGFHGPVLMPNMSSFLLTGFRQNPTRSRWSKQLRLAPHLSLLGLLS
jgi:NADPH:quinone reductase-like Zn-dependent oxidoreductase